MMRYSVGDLVFLYGNEILLVCRHDEDDDLDHDYRCAWRSNYTVGTLHGWIELRNRPVAPKDLYED